MKILGKMINTADMELTLSITMTLKEWEDLKNDLPTRYPHWKLAGAISDAVVKANTIICEEIKSE